MADDDDRRLGPRAFVTSNDLPIVPRPEPVDVMSWELGDRVVVLSICENAGKPPWDRARHIAAVARRAVARAAASGSAKRQGALSE